MDKGSLLLKINSKESFSFDCISSVCNSLIKALKKINELKSSLAEYKVGYINGDGFGFSLILNQVSVSDVVASSEYSAFSYIIDILSMRKFMFTYKDYSVEVKEDKVILTKDDNNNEYPLEVYNMYTLNKSIEDLICKIFSCLSKNKNQLMLTYKNNPIERKIAYVKEDYPKCARKIDFDSLFTNESYTSSMALMVEQLDLNGNATWKFKNVVNNNTFKAKILDKEFNESLRSGNVIIGYGLILKGDVTTSIVKDKSGKILNNKSSYVIDKVNDVLYSSQSEALGLDL